MKFTNTDRTLMAMLLQRGTAADISGYCQVGRFQRIWSVRYMPKTSMHDAYYSGTVGGIYDKIAIADTLNECLNKLEEIIKDYS